ncbi:Hypothetical protein SCF082_LOCUS29492 [Durusdinium trenchii]|uniref:Uncharacterized protein n=1 Tax=Durusdinium trenchii TaxID=1381693 RepID=A0ABP0MU66_9DINO
MAALRHRPRRVRSKQLFGICSVVSLLQLPCFLAPAALSLRSPAPSSLTRLTRAVAEDVAVYNVEERILSEEDLMNSRAAYETWKDQFPLAAARREYYGLNCSQPAVEERFQRLAELLGISTGDALEMFRKDFWVLAESTDTLVPKLEALRSCGTEQEILDFLRMAPRSIATTSSQEIQERGLGNMLLRSVVGEVYELIASPLRLLIRLNLQRSAQEVEQQRVEKTNLSNEEILQEERKRNSDRLRSTGYAFFATLIGTMSWASYMDATYGGPVHGKGFCFPAGIMPAYNIPDAEGNARLPCNCAPLYKWYLEPLMSAEQKESMSDAAPKVDSKNCGKAMGGEKKECDPTTVGGCVWTAEDLEKPPNAWENREELYWERQRPSN